MTRTTIPSALEHEVASGAVGLQLEALGVVHRLLLLIDEESAGDEDNDSICAGGLGVEGGNLVLNLLEGESAELLSDGRDTLDRACLEGKHRLVTVEASQASAVSVKGLVVELHKLLGDSVEISHFEEVVGLE